MKSFLLMTSAILALQAESFAQEAPTTDSVSEDFTPEYFERFSPRTALDMVEEVPGFQFREEGEDRGLGQARENILINGRRVSGKSNNTRDALSRITASSVERIELRDGQSIGLPGLSGLVVNVVTQSQPLSGNWEWRPQLRDQVDPNFQRGSLSLSGRRGGLNYSISLDENGSHRADYGPEWVTSPSGQLLDVRNEDLIIIDDQPSIAVGLSYETLSDIVINFNAQYELFNGYTRERSWRGIDSIDRFSLFERSQDRKGGEIGTDIEFDLGNGRLKLIGLHQFQEDDQLDMRRLITADAAPDTGSRFLRDSSEQESILRGEYTWSDRENDWQISLESAFNTLEIDSELFSLNSNGIFDPVPLTNGSSKVEERRAEVNATHTRILNESWSAQFSLGTEYSELLQDGPQGLTRDFVRPKGFVHLTYDHDENTSYRMNLERRVGQISFSDFIASVDLEEGNRDSGNPELVPPQTWEVELGITRQFGAFGTLNGQIYYQLVDDIIDIVPIGTMGQSVGNLEQAERVGISFDGTFNFDPLGWTGAKLDYEITYQDSWVEDPLTGTKRPISGDSQWVFRPVLRYDIPQTDWAVGADYFDRQNAPVLRLDQIFEFSYEPAFASVFVEHKDILGANVRVSVFNYHNVNERGRRTVFENRRDGPVDFIEDKSRFFRPVLSLTVSGEF